VIDINTGKGQILTSLIVGLAAGHAINDEPRSKDIPGAVNFARLLMQACNRGMQRAIEEHVDPAKSKEENYKAVQEACPNRELTTLAKSFSYDQLKEMMGMANALQLLSQNIGETIQHTAHALYPKQFMKDVEEHGFGYDDRPHVYVIDLSGLDQPPPRKPGKEPMVS